MAVSPRRIFIAMALDPESARPSLKGTNEPPPEEFARLHKYRSRGLANLEKLFGDLPGYIRARLADREQLRVLEIGCGYGTALVELRAAFGDRLDLHGINRHARHGSWATARRSVAKLGLMSEEEFMRLAPPTIHYHDLDQLLPFPDDRFDLIVSQISFVYLKHKAELLEDVNRVLAPEGVARLDVNIEFPANPGEYRLSFEIWKDGKNISFWDHASQFAGLVKGEGPTRPYLEVHKTPSLRLGLEYVTDIELSKIHSAWWGRKSIYRVAPDAI
jgi:SAM-dependent methyltransferase